MSWTLGNKLWTFPFRSVNGTSCRIDIYARGYTGDPIFTLKAAANPVTFEDGNGEDLLNDVIRSRTGYIRLIEEYYNGWLDQIYPQTKFDRYVEITYGESIIFRGFIQLQDFSSEQIPAPRELELPIISPLGLMEYKTFSNVSYLPPRSVTILSLLDSISSAFGYQYLYVPRKYGYPNTISLDKTISSLIVSPWNENFHYSDESPMYKVMKGQTYQYLIEAVCKAFAWICHDTPEGLVFTAFDYEGDFLRYTIGHTDDSSYTSVVTISSTVALTDYFELADNHAQIKSLLPESGIQISYEGETGNRQFSFAHFYVPSEDPIVYSPDYDPQYPNHSEIFSLCSLLPVPLTGETDLLGTFSFTENRKLSIGHHAVAWNGHEGVLVSLGSYPNLHDLFYLRFYLKRRSNQAFGIEFDILKRSDGSLSGLNYQTDEDGKHYISTLLDANMSHPDYVQVNFRYIWGGDYPQLPSQALLFIYNIQLKVYEHSEPYADYTHRPATDDDIIPDTFNPPAISANISMPISLYRLSDNLIGDTVRSQKLTEYAYVLNPRKSLVAKFRISNDLALPYSQLLTYLNLKWRIIAMSWNLWDDEVTIYAQHSSLL